MISKIILFLLLLFFPTLTHSYNSILNTKILNNGDQILSVPIETLILITTLTFLPSILLTMTSFTRIIIVFSLLRSALGTPYSPPNQILLGLGLILTFFIMQPTFKSIYLNAYKPFSENKINVITALSRSEKPLKNFMIKQTNSLDLALFSNLSNNNFHFINKKQNIPMYIVIPAFIISELQTAFKIGFLIFIPFLIVDLVVSSVLMSLGMMMVPPSTISLPFKLMLFVLVNGWQLLIGSLAHSFY
ncbi:flagellar type III secretion system pore protein FliP [Buchnera aphidicola]|uniref:Flagellar biosynthetic protein FliP n=1 Tax=Buchnera aphidicola (Anoecia oenotherae) TaxID=1241833 RepID=A0A4D6XXI2_9GAMM|nr:flagellar type III secretion system pore protein FliP [Buchnera aphidicola]QCI19204.1 flagellar biosynthetic protein FliP [Buchnera aphidicola (Anoecia oenotherae)]